MNNPLPEDKYLATAGEWETFTKSNIWHDLQLYLLMKIDNHRANLEMTPLEREHSMANPEPDDMIRGRIRENLDLMNLPEILTEELVAQQEEEDDKVT